MSKILVIDSEGNEVANTLSSNGFHVHLAENGREGLTYLKEKVCELAIMDIDLDDIKGLELIKKAKSLAPELFIIVTSKSESVQKAVEAMQMGASHYIAKPITFDQLSPYIQQVNEKSSFGKAKGKEPALPSQVIIAESPVMKKILEEVSRIAKSQANVFITGESGTGKEVIAQAIHYQSLRENNPFIRVNCAALAETLIESEFFGHEKGSFTGASGLKLGRFELAHTGTLLLDEVTEIPLSLQAKLLRVVQEQEFERVGGTKSLKIDVRLISTSNRDVQTALNEKKLREDLFYRLNVVPVQLPPLRERKDDILPLAHYFLKKLCESNLKPKKELSEDAMERLLGHGWPGNIRELANTIERAIVLTDDAVIRGKDLALDLMKRVATDERSRIIEALVENEYIRTKTAKKLGITVRVLNRKISEFQIPLPD